MKEIKERERRVDRDWIESDKRHTYTHEEQGI